MINYPNTLPTEALILIVDRLRGKSNDWNAVLLASWNLLGFALSQISLNSPDRILEAYDQAASISIETEEETIQKHNDIVKLLKKKLTIRQIAGLTNKSTNTVLKVKSTASKLQMI